MVTRLYNGMRSVQETHSSHEAIPWVAKEQFLVFASTLFKGNAQEKSGIVLKMVSGAQKTVKGSQIVEVSRPTSRLPSGGKRKSVKSSQSRGGLNLQRS
ncbi:TLD domain-containing protein, partial [Ophiophagus hannah]